MKVFFDTNVLLDSVLNRPERENALKLMLAVANEEIEGFVSANSITDLYYISRKGIGDEGARAAIENILNMFDVACVDGEACFSALYANMSDYEDAILAMCAEREGAEYIVSRDEGFINSEGSPVQVLHPGELLNILNKE